MSKRTPERRAELLLYGTLSVAGIMFIIALALILLEVYVRWYLNKSFTFLGGFELEALLLAATALLLGALYVHRPRE